MVSGFVLIKTDIGQLREVFEKTKKVKGVKKAHMVTGSFDVILQVEAEDMSTITGEVIEKIREIDGVNKTTTSIVTGE